MTEIGARLACEPRRSVLNCEPVHNLAGLEFNCAALAQARKPVGKQRNQIDNLGASPSRGKIASPNEARDLRNCIALKLAWAKSGSALGGISRPGDFPLRLPGGEQNRLRKAVSRRSASDRTIDALKTGSISVHEDRIGHVGRQPH